MIRMDRYSIEEAKKSLEICDHMNVDIEWLIVRVEQLQKENAILQKRVDVFERAKLIWERRNGGASELNDASQEANHYNWLDEQNEKLQSRLAECEKAFKNLFDSISEPLFSDNRLPYVDVQILKEDLKEAREYFKKWGGV